VTDSGCLICGGPLQQPATGRPPTYCGTACRRAARYERQRLQRRLTTLETGLANLRALGPGLTTPAYLASLQEQIDRAEARLLALLAGPDDAAVSG
jgi:hypothetical protein